MLLYWPKTMTVRSYNINSSGQFPATENLGHIESNQLVLHYQPTTSHTNVLDFHINIAYSRVRISGRDVRGVPDMWVLGSPCRRFFYGN